MNAPSRKNYDAPPAAHAVAGGETTPGQSSDLDTLTTATPWEPIKISDATALTPFDRHSPDLLREIVVTFGAHAKSNDWKPVPTSIANALDKLITNKVGDKDGPAWVLADAVPGARTKNGVKAIYAAGLDIDSGLPGQLIDAEMIEFGRMGVRYTTHIHMKGETRVKKDMLIAWAMKHRPEQDAEEAEVIRAFLREARKYEPTIADTAELDRIEHGENGIEAVISHAAMPKHRVVYFFASPFDISTEARTQREALNLWRTIPQALARRLGNLPIDSTGCDPNRLFFLPRRRAEDAPFEISLVGGPLLDWRELLASDPGDALETVAKSFGGAKSKTDKGRDLGRSGWATKAAAGFSILDVLRDHAPEKIRHDTGSKAEIECPFDDDHSNSGDSADRACFAVSAGEGTSEVFTISCRHDGCRDKTNLDMLGKMITDRWFEESAIHNEGYNAILSLEPTTPAQVERQEKALKQVAKEEARGAYQALVAGVAKDTAGPAIAEAIAAVLAAGLDDIDEGKALDAIRKQGGVTSPDMKKQVARYRRQIEAQNRSEPASGDLFFQGEQPDEVTTFINARAAMVATTAGPRVVRFDTPNGEPSFMRVRDAEDWFDQVRCNDQPGFLEWKKHPERRNYMGMGFYPGNYEVPAGVLNFWTPNDLKPMQGDWSKIKHHMLHILCRDNEEHYAYLAKYVAHMLQRPWEKPGIALILQSYALGTGKNTFVDALKKLVGVKYCPDILSGGQITNRFNAPMETAILLILQEAFFPGDQATASMTKTYVSDHYFPCERKNVDAYQARNYMRLIFLSNRDWVVSAAGGERRYFCLEVSDEHADDREYFGKLKAEMENGGLEAMLYHFLHEVDVSDFMNMQVPHTSGLAKQIALSFDPADRWLESWLIEGRLPFRGEAPFGDKVTDAEWVNPHKPEGTAYAADATGMVAEKKTILASYSEFVPGHRAHPPTLQTVGEFLAKRIPDLRTGKRGPAAARVPVYFLPPLEIARAAFLAAHKGYQWPADMEEPTQAPLVLPELKKRVEELIEAANDRLDAAA